MDYRNQKYFQQTELPKHQLTFQNINFNTVEIQAALADCFNLLCKFLEKPRFSLYP